MTARKPRRAANTGEVVVLAGPVAPPPPPSNPTVQEARRRYDEKIVEAHRFVHAALGFIQADHHRLMDAWEEIDQPMRDLHQGIKDTVRLFKEITFVLEHADKQADRAKIDNLLKPRRNGKIPRTPLFRDGIWEFG